MDLSSFSFSKSAPVTSLLSNSDSDTTLLSVNSSNETGGVLTMINDKNAIFGGNLASLNDAWFSGSGNPSGSTETMGSVAYGGNTETAGSVAFAIGAGGGFSGAGSSAPSGGGSFGGGGSFSSVC